jgi:hypothetical protein
MLPLAGDNAARFEAGSDRSVGGGRAQHPVDCQGGWGPAADCQPLAASLCRPWPRRAARQAAAGQAADLYEGHRQADSAAAGQAGTGRVCALDRPLLAEALGDVDVQYVWRFLRNHKIDLVARKSWCESNDPNFTAKAADVVGLYVAPPAKAIVLCVDEKPSIQALERAQGYLKLPNGRALTGQSHDYKRHGTTTLFAALEVATGKIIATHSKRRRRVEFLDFMDSVTAAFPDRQLHVILDNLNTHKKNEHWLKAHPNVQFHFTPTSASWLNQVEVWFSILQGQSLSGTSFTSLKQLQAAHRCLHQRIQRQAEPFVWTKKKVRQRRFKGRRITQL